MRILLDTNILVDYFRSQRSSRPKNQRQAYKNISAQEEKRILENLPLMCDILDTN
jgi:hypothetical protein